jgi:hypothetical protein
LDVVDDGISLDFWYLGHMSNEKKNEFLMNEPKILLNE